MHPSFASRYAIALAAAVLVTGACSDSPGEPTARPPADIEIVAGEDQVGAAGAQLETPVIVLVLDATGEPVANHPVSFHVMAGGGSIQDATPRTDALGFAGARWTLGTAIHDEQRLEVRAAAGGVTLASASIFATAGPAAPARMEVVPPSPQGNVYPGVRVVDQFGNPVPGVTVTFTVVAGGGTVEGATVTSNALGVATVGRWTLGEPGANTLRATSGTLAPVTYTIMQQSRVPARVILSAGQDQTAEVGSMVPVAPSVIVQNDAGTPLSDIVVTFTPGPNSGNVSTTTVTTGMNGMATLGGWSLGPVVGVQTLVASASPTATFTFTAHATPARVGRLEKHAGDAQVTTPGGTLSTPPAVKVLDVYGNAVPGIAVTFSVYNGGGSITGASAVSNASGIAAVGSWTLGPFAGTQTLRASAEGASDVDFTASATAGAAALIRAHHDNPTIGIPRQEITLSVIVVDDIDRPKAGIAVSFAPRVSHIYGGGSVVSPSQNVITNAAGVASVRYVMPGNIYAPGGVLASASGLPTLQVDVLGMTGPADRIVVTLPEASAVAGGDLGRPTFSVLDAYGNSIAFTPVVFTVTGGGGTVDGASEVTMSTAQPPFTTASGPLWKSGPVAGVNTLVVSSPMLEGGSVTITRTTTPP